MTFREERELLKLVKENNIMLRNICMYIQHSGNHTDDFKDFTMNVAANVLSNNFRK